MKKGLLTLILIYLIGFFLFVINFFPSLSEANCIKDEEFKKIELNGVVEKKYIDSSQHSYPMIEVRQFDVDILVVINLVGDIINSFDKIQINDTVKKSREDNSISLRRKEGELVISVDFGCNR